MTTPLGPPQAPSRAQFSSSSLVAYSGLASDEAEDEEGVLGDFTARRMVKLTEELQPRKAKPPMWVTESGMVKFSKELQPLQAPSAMWVTEFGMVKLAKELQKAKA